MRPLRELLEDPNRNYVPNPPVNIPIHVHHPHHHHCHHWNKCYCGYCYGCRRYISRPTPYWRWDANGWYPVANRCSH